MAHQAIEIEEISPAVENETARSAAESIGEDQLCSTTKREQFMPTRPTSPPKIYHKGSPVDADARSHDDAVNSCLVHVRRRLGESQRSFQARDSSHTIFEIPQSLRDINSKAVKPEIVSIGPYYWDKPPSPEFAEHKWFFLKRFLRRTDSNEESLVKLVAGEEISARGCYSKTPKMSKGDFLMMMLLDGCFVVEVLLHISRKDREIDEDDPILKGQGIIPILIRDLLKLENQVPYSLLQSLFDFSSSTKIEAKTPYLCMLALRVFNRVYPIPSHDEYTNLQYRHYDEIKSRDEIKSQQYKHLLDLFNFTLALFKPVHDDNRQKKYRPSSIPCVTQLRPSGIKFKSKKTESFLDISFQKRVLKIPSIFIDDFMITVLINCTALEQCQEDSSKHITDYISFMQCLINQPKDVSLLCSDGIISTLSYDDQHVANLFNDLGKSIVFNVRDCYLSKQFEELESYYSSNWASMIRTYFSSPWAVISVFSAFLIIALTITQTVYAILSQHFR